MLQVCKKCVTSLQREVKVKVDNKERVGHLSDN